ncbi:MAG: cytochrome c [Sandaracinaceae bacterium]|nr:cytochrome c [Sandaracinaceae bacterium]
MLRTSVGILALSLAAAGCGGGGGGAAEPGEVAAEFQGPIASSDVARGEELYNGICMSCHAGGAPALDHLGWEPAAMRQQVRRGQGRMPAIGASRLSAEDLEAILAYLATTGAVNGGAAATAGDEAPAEGADDDAGGESAEGDGA